MNLSVIRCRLAAMTCLLARVALYPLITHNTSSIISDLYHSVNTVVAHEDVVYYELQGVSE